MIPQIKVVVGYGKDQAEYMGSHFIDAIGFLVECEAWIRRSQNLKEPVDVSTTKIGREQLRKLLNKETTNGQA